MADETKLSVNPNDIEVDATGKVKLTAAAIEKLKKDVREAVNKKKPGAARDLNAIRVDI
jgi:hypothetical protein